ncbi:MAG TPA: YdeI/OmpD-associated family protein [Egibacteraceae bacterium]|jgi:uncharacterized protein YdeI (YjbR/CyaY-like superfamily)|nr:YdeI/OmpD-associated family protein [Egibacteraceae bacterium]
MVDGAVPPTVSAHPPTWKFDYPIYHAETRAAWRAWLSAYHAAAPGVWLASWKRSTRRPAVAYDEAVEEALCFGWIDSTVNTLDEERGLQLMTPRKPRSSWTRLNRARVARLEAEGRMTEAGRRAVEAAQRNGWWLLYDTVEDLVEPDALAAALDAVPQARAHWDAFPPSARKQMLWWVVSAAKADTKARRIAAIVAGAEQGRRVGE